MILFDKLKTWWQMKTVERTIRIFESIQKYEQNPFIVQNLRNYTEQLKKAHSIAKNAIRSKGKEEFKRLLVEFSETYRTLDLVTDRTLDALKAHNEGKV